MERNSNLGYIAVKKQATKLAPLTPTVYVPAYSEGLTTDPNFVEDNAIIGAKFKNFLTAMGNRSHNGDIEVLGEPNIAGYLADCFATKGTTTGADPYTHPFTFSKTTDPNYYTIDISYVTHVVRFWGCGISDLEPGWENGEMRLKGAVSALKCFAGRELASVPTGTNPYTIVFTTTYDPRPTDGLVVGDILQLFDVSLGTYVNFTVASIPDATSITTTTDVTSGAAGDFVTIRPATPSYTLVGATEPQPFLWGNTEFRFGATAAAALSATHTPLEEDSGWHLMHEFEDDGGSHRSGSFDPASLPRMQASAEFKAKVYFDTPQELQRYNALEKRAVVCRHFVYSGGKTYELRVTLNNMKAKNPKPSLEAENILYSEIDYVCQNDLTDGQGADIKVLNAIASI